LRVNDVCSFTEMDSITEYVVDESKIADELQQMRDDGDENPSIIRWCLDNHAEHLKEWCWVNDKDELEGPFSKYFEQAMRLEGCKRNISKHACGIAISNEPLEELVPMIYDKGSGEQVIGLDMKSCESSGLVKMDILGLSLLNKLQKIQKLLLE